MTILFIEGFDHFSTAQLTDKKNIVDNANCTVGAFGRFGGRGLSLTTNIYYFRVDFKTNKSTIYFGIAFKKVEGQSPVASFAQPWIVIMDEAGVSQIRLIMTANNGISAYFGDGTLLGSTADHVIPNIRWIYLEGKITISDTVGEVTLRVNETQVLNLTSKDTKYGSDYIRFIKFHAINSGIDVYYDDLYVDDAQFHGDCRVKVFVPDSISGTNNSFTASAGNKNECVDEIYSNEDTDYIYSSTLNHKQGFGITTGALGTVKAIQLNNHCRDDAAGSRKITPFIRSNSTDYLGTESDVITSEYLFESDVWETDPDDSNPWTQTKLEAAEFGLEITT